MTPLERSAITTVYRRPLNALLIGVPMAAAALETPECATGATAID
jgi:hypothetical protein